MKSDYNQLLIYEFKIVAVSPIYFGGSKKGELIKDSKGQPILFGNSIGGALRNYLKLFDITDVISKYLGGEQNEEFLESLIYISDGNIELNDKIGHKEGTKINYKYGSAEKKHKYTIEYLPPNTVITFKVECEIQDKCSEETFEKIIGTWEKGFSKKEIKLGGQQNNGFGEFNLKQLNKIQHEFRTKDELDQYIFSLSETESRPTGSLPSYKKKDENQIYFSLEGEFPYGVYQGFRDEGNSDLTGIQKRGNDYYLPATSFKGLVKNEIRILLSRFLKDETSILRKLDEIFGGHEQKGKIIFSDIVLKDSGKVTTKRFEKPKENKKDKKNKEVSSEKSIYIKIDRLTGSAFDGAMMKQREIYGNAVLNCILMDSDQDESPYIFPLFYVLKRIGEGFLPIGGRTSIGLGRFFGTKLELSCKGESNAVEETFILNEQNDEQIDERNEKQINKIKNYFAAFEGWCEK